MYMYVYVNVYVCVCVSFSFFFFLYFVFPFAIIKEKQRVTDESPSFTTCIDTTSNNIRSKWWATRGKVQHQL
jgi:hypothetical protein